VLRGALDGLATAVLVGDPDWVSLRGENALTLEGKTPALKLDDFFALNPAMPNLARMFKANEAIIVHAPPLPIASARISMARTCWRAASKSRAQPAPAAEFRLLGEQKLRSGIDC
jgi:uncharacterized protein (DUF1501 family)